jgi:hypothetical protein
MWDMNMKTARIVGSTIALLVLGLIFIVGVRAQQTANNSSSSSVTTNWVGYLVAGQTDPADRITRSSSPTIIRQVELGLRSDGVVIWREATKGK